MNMQDIVGQIAQQAIQNPQVLTDLMNHPYSSVKQVTGEQEVSRDEVSQVLAGVSGLASGNKVDFANLAGIASQLLAANDGSAHTMATSLLGAQTGDAAQSGVSADAISNITKMLGAGAIPGVDLSDGLDIKDAIGFVGAMLGKK